MAELRCAAVSGDPGTRCRRGAGNRQWRPDRSKPSSRRRRHHCEQLWPSRLANSTPRLQPAKFTDPLLTAEGEPRARVELSRLQTLWFNTGTLCNIACRNCYFESSPKNDRLAYITREEVALFLEEISLEGWGTEEIGFTGGEPFINPEIFGESRGLSVTWISGAGAQQCDASHATEQGPAHGSEPQVRTKSHDPRIARSFHGRATRRRARTRNLQADARRLDLAGPKQVFRARRGPHDVERGRSRQRAGYARLFAEHAIPIDASDHAKLVLFPEMDARADVPEIATHCWKILDKSPVDVMCAPRA